MGVCEGWDSGSGCCGVEGVEVCGLAVELEGWKLGGCWVGDDDDGGSCCEGVLVVRYVLYASKSIGIFFLRER